MTSILAAFQFLTIFPPLIRRALTPEELGRSVGWYPLAGLGLGGALFGVHWLVRPVLPDAVLAVLLLILWAALTRALHLDGFMDVCDGLFGGFTPERRLEIMRDSRVGAFGAAAGVLLLLTKFVLIGELIAEPLALILATVLGRWAVSMAVVQFPYARERGMGRQIKDQAGRVQMLIATLTALLAAAALFGCLGMYVLVGAGAAAGVIAALVLRRIPGLTGDVYGAICESIEILALLALVIW